MFTITAHHNQYLRMGQDTIQAVLSVSVDAGMQMAPAPLALGIALDHSGSMEGPKMRAARDGAIKVVQAIDASMAFMVVTFNDNARVIFGPAMGTNENKLRAVETLKSVYASGGTRMSTALNAIVDKFGGKDQGRATKILFLTDGKNEGEQRSPLNQAVARCTNANISISAWGVGTDWDAAELRHMADATHGTADIILRPSRSRLRSPPHLARCVRQPSPTPPCTSGRQWASRSNVLSRSIPISSRLVQSRTRLIRARWW